MNTNAPAAALPDPQAAYSNLFQGIHQRVFFNKCAAAGFQPRSAEEAEWMLDTAGKLRYVEEQAPVKAAADKNNPYYNMNQALNGVMAQYGLDGGIKQAQIAEEEMAIKDASDQFAQNPVLYNSVLALKAAEAAQLQAQWQASQAGRG